MRETAHISDSTFRWCKSWQSDGCVRDRLRAHDRYSDNARPTKTLLALEQTIAIGPWSNSLQNDRARLDVPRGRTGKKCNARACALDQRPNVFLGAFRKLHSSTGSGGLGMPDAGDISACSTSEMMLRRLKDQDRGLNQIPQSIALHACNDSSHPHIFDCPLHCELEPKCPMRREPVEAPSQKLAAADVLDQSPIVSLEKQVQIASE